MVKWYKKKIDESKKEGGTFTASSIFGLKDEEMVELIKIARHAQIDGDSMEDIAEALDIYNGGSIAAKGFIFGKMCAMNDMKGDPAKALGMFLK